MQLRQTSLLWLFAASLGLSGLGCSEAEADPAPATALDADGLPAGPYRDRDAKLAKQLVDGGALLLDVRTPEEFASGHLDGAVNINHSDVAEQIATIEQMQGGDPHKPIVLYCRSGHRAGLAKRELEAAGFDRVTNLGGMNAWRD